MGGFFWEGESENVTKSEAPTGPYVVQISAEYLKPSSRYFGGKKRYRWMDDIPKSIDLQFAYRNASLTMPARTV